MIAFLMIFGCKPYDKKDVYNEAAVVETDELVHEKNSLEWWYFTGHLKEKNGDRTFGIEYVFFHTNPLGVKDYSLMNFGLTDPQNNKFYFDYEIKALKNRLRSENPISLKTPNDGKECSLTGFNGNYMLNGKMKNHSIAINLNTTNNQKALLHEGRGYKKYGDLAEAGYYSFTRLPADGTIELNGESIEVEGLLWYDRQWNCGEIFGGKVSWDWMAIQLNETEDDIMAYQVTTPRIEEKQIFGGTYYNPNFQINLTNENLNLNPIEYWESEKTGVKYPIKWEVELPKQNTFLTVEALVKDQELDFRFGAYTMKYWEGMCKVTGTKDGKNVTGNAYLEMTNRRIANKIEKDLLANQTP